MKHTIKLDAPAILKKGEHVAQFGGGYRQVSGPDIASGNVLELLEQARKSSPAERAKLFIYNADGGVPLTIDEVEEQVASGTGGGWVVGNGKPA